MKLGDLKIGDKFRFSEGNPNYNYGRPYLVIDFDLENYSFNVITDITKVKMCLDLVAYKIVGFNGDAEIEQDHDNIPV